MVKLDLQAVVAAAAVMTATISVTQAAAAPLLSNRTIKLGSTYYIRGQTRTLPGSTAHVEGPLTLRGSWDGGPWHVITRTHTVGSTGRYRVDVHPTRRGVLRLRLRAPDSAYSVVLTVV